MVGTRSTIKGKALSTTLVQRDKHRQLRILTLHVERSTLLTYAWSQGALGLITLARLLPLMLPAPASRATSGYRPLLLTLIVPLAFTLLWGRLASAASLGFMPQA